MNLWSSILWVSLGGALGALGRTGLGALATQWLGHAPVGTMMANIIGCAIMGLAKGAVAQHDWGSEAARAFLFSGMLGAFTTFSTFEAETVGLWQEGNRLLAISYCVSSILLGLLAFGLGWWAMIKWS